MVLFAFPRQDFRNRSDWDGYVCAFLEEGIALLEYRGKQK